MTTEAPHKFEIKPKSITAWKAFYHLLALRGAVKLEAKGLKHSSGRSMTTQARRELQLKRNTPHETVIEELTKRIEKILGAAE